MLTNGLVDYYEILGVSCCAVDGYFQPVVMHKACTASWTQSYPSATYLPVEQEQRQQH
jgi:hypothetical protein